MPYRATLEPLLTRFNPFRRKAPANAAQAEQAVLSQVAKLVGHVFFHEDRAASPSPSRLIGITAPINGEGSTTIAGLMALELSRAVQFRSLLVSTRVLERLHPQHLEAMDELWRPSASSSFWVHNPALVGKTVEDGPWRIDLAFRRRVVEALRSHFDNVILDCRSVRNASDVAVLAPLIDGFVLVVRSDSATRHQLEQAIQYVQATGADLKGCVFNRRTYPVPERLYRFLKRSR